MEYLNGVSSTLTKAMRAEIVGSLYHRVLQYTTTPSLTQYEAVCLALVSDVKSYLTFNISYPRFLSSALLFMQHYIFSITIGTQKLQLSLTRLYNDLLKKSID